MQYSLPIFLVGIGFIAFAYVYWSILSMHPTPSTVKKSRFWLRFMDVGIALVLIASVVQALVGFEVIVPPATPWWSR